MQRGARFELLASAAMQRGARFASFEIVLMQRGALFTLLASVPKLVFQRISLTFSGFLMNFNDFLKVSKEFE